MRSNDDGASVASSGSTERRSAGSKASAAAGPGGELPMLPVGDPFDLDAGETIQVRLRVLAVPPYLRQDGASPTSGGGKGGKPQVVRRSEVPLEQALHALFEFVGVLLLETTGPGSSTTAHSPPKSPVASVAAASPPTTPDAAEAAVESTAPGMPALLAVRVRGSVCVSHLRLGDRSVRLGRTGYVTGWRDVPFQFPVLNRSPVATVCKITRMPEVIELPDAEIGADGALCIPLQPFETLHVSAKLRGSLLQAPQAKEQRSWHIEMSNLHNPSNTLQLLVSAEVTVLRLRYTGLRWHGHAKNLADPRNSAGRKEEASDPSEPLPMVATAAESSSKRRLQRASRDESDDLRDIDGTGEGDGGESNLSSSITSADGSVSSGIDALKKEATGAAEAAKIDAILEDSKRSGYVRSDDGGVLAALPLPPITFPALPSSPLCTADFELHNCSEEVLNLLLHVASDLEAPPNEYQEALAELRRSLSFELLSVESGVPLSSISLPPGERLSLRVIVHPSPSASLLTLLPLEAPLLLGVLHVQSATSSAADDDGRPGSRNEDDPSSATGVRVRRIRESHDDSVSESTVNNSESGQSRGGGSVHGSSMSREGASGMHDTICLVSSLRRGASFTLNVSHLNFHGAIKPLGGSSSTKGVLSPTPSIAHSLGLLSSPPLSPAVAPAMPPAPEQVESFWVRNPSLERTLSVRIVPEVPAGWSCTRRARARAPSTR